MPWSLIFGHLRANKLRTALTGGSVVIAIFLYCFLQTFLTTLTIVGNTGDAQRLITASAVSLFQTLPRSAIEKIKAARIPGVRDLGWWNWFDGVYIDPKNFFARFAVDVPALRQQYSREFQMSEAAWTRFQQERKSCVIGRGLAARYQLGVDSSVVLEGTIYPGTYSFTVAGIYTSGNPAYDEESMYFHWDYVNDTIGQPNLIGMITVRIEDASKAPEICDRIDELFRNTNSRTLTQPEAAFSAQFISMWGNVGLLFEFIGGAVLFATFMITLNTMLLAIKERVREIGVLKTLGFRRATLGWLYVAESTLLCGGAALLGIALARGLFHGQTIVFGTVILPSFLCTDGTIGRALLLGALLAGISGLAPALYARHLPIVRAMRLD